MIYLASPYSHLSSAIRYARFLAARDYTWRCMQLGEIIFSPIAYGHQFAQAYGASAAAVDWQALNESMILGSHAVRVLRLEGWEKSAGVDMEIRFAKTHGIEVEYADA